MTEVLVGPYLDTKHAARELAQVPSHRNQILALRDLTSEGEPRAEQDGGRRWCRFFWRCA